MANPVTAIQKLYNETVTELKKCTWPTRKEVSDATSTVISSMLILTVAVMVFDWIFQAGVKLLANMN